MVEADKGLHAFVDEQYYDHYTQKLWQEYKWEIMDYIIVSCMYMENLKS